MNGWLTAAAILAVVLAAVLLRSLAERRHLTAETVTVPAVSLGTSFDGFTIVLLADLHGASFGPRQAELVNAVRQAKPDLVVYGGDMITAKHGRVKGFPELETVLAGLEGLAPAVWVEGNHEPRLPEDRRRELEGLYGRHGVRDITGATERVTRAEGDGTLTVTGVPFREEAYRKFRRTSGIPASWYRDLMPADGTYRVLAAHTPLWYADYAEAGADLVLSGHVHGGIVRIPGIGGVATPQWRFFFPYTRGLYCREGAGGKPCRLAVSAGLGTHTVNLRLNNRSQVLVIKLKCGTDHGGNGQTGQL